MPTGALIVLALLLGIAAGFLLAMAIYTLELRRLARNIEERDPASNARLSLNTRPPALPALVSAINAELDRSAQARIAAQRGQREFQRDLASLSHDIRTPLMGAKGYLQLAVGETNPGVRDERLAAATQRIDATAALLDQLFSYTKASDPDLTLAQEAVELRPLVEQVLLGHYPEFEARGWEPELRVASADSMDANASTTATSADATCTVIGDREAFGRIVENLVSNALRYGSGAPTITLGGAEVLTISNPVAHPEAIDTEHLFDRFYQADTARGQGGAGLGLATSAKLARAMGLTLVARIDGPNLTIAAH